ncbi:ComF family protein [Limnobacter thiooxidans]|nr:ComF family protein [Limnobacter thiooxidans]
MKPVYETLYRTCRLVSDTAMPRRCASCQGGIQGGLRTGGLNDFLCRSCLSLLLEMPKVRCKRCGLMLGPRPQAFGWTHCRHCRPLLATRPENKLDCVICCDYSAPFDQWITRLKYGKAHGMAKFLGHWLGLKTQETTHLLPDLLIPVPCSNTKLKQRGYNQAALIARHAGRVLKRPVYTDWLIKTSEASAQAELGREARLQNLLGAFQTTRPMPSNTRIGLVDDVITTGATLQSCVAALEKAGADSIVLMAVCRTPE